MVLSLKQVKDVCLINGGANMCKYLDEEFDDNGKLIDICKKISPDSKIIDSQLVEFLTNMKSAGLDPKQQGVPLGDNCQGYLPLKAKIQGYDQKP